MTFPNPLPTIPQGAKLHCHSPRMSITIYDKQNICLQGAWSILIFLKSYTYQRKDFAGDTVVKNAPGNAGDVGSIPGLGKFPGVGNGNLLQYSCLGNSMDRGGVGYRQWNLKASDTTE